MKYLLLALAIAPAACSESPASGKPPIALINVSYDPTRELYKEISASFSKEYEAKTGQKVKVHASHGGSGAQSRAVLGGLKADLVTLALASDIEALEDRGFIKPGWPSRFPSNSCPYTSSIVLLVRQGNPKGIRGWNDLVREDVAVITPNPKTSGGARWNFLAAWGWITQNGGTEEQAAEFVRKLYARVPVLDAGARASATTFVQRKIGDVFITWENEAILAIREARGGALEIVYPEVTILAEPPVAVVDRNVDAKSTREAAEAFVSYLYTDEAQEIIGRRGYRPANPAILAKFKDTLPSFKKLFTVKEAAGSWKEAQKRFFSDGGVFDRVLQPELAR